MRRKYREGSVKRITFGQNSIETSDISGDELDPAKIWACGSAMVLKGDGHGFWVSFQYEIAPSHERVVGRCNQSNHGAGDCRIAFLVRRKQGTCAIDLEYQ